MRIVDSDGKDLPPYQVGEILYQGENLMAGYWAREEATAQAIRDGWFHTGDAGYVDEEGFIFLKDRIKDMIVSGSENVYPAEVEAVLMGASRSSGMRRHRRAGSEVGRDRESRGGQAARHRPYRRRR